MSEAIISLETAVRLQPNLRTAWRDLYELRASEGNDVAAADAYRRSLGSQQGLDPLLTQVLDLMQAGRLGVAEGICREYLKRRPHDVDAIRLLAEIGITLGMLDEAIYCSNAVWSSRQTSRSLRRTIDRVGPSTAI